MSPCRFSPEALPDVTFRLLIRFMEQRYTLRWFVLRSCPSVFLYFLFYQIICQPSIMNQSASWVECIVTSLVFIQKWDGIQATPTTHLGPIAGNYHPAPQSMHI